MIMDLTKFLIVWGPTLLFIIIVCLGILLGCWRGFRKSLILFIHMLVIGIGCLILFLCLVNDANLDAKIVSLSNSILVNFNGSSLQELLQVDESYTTLHQMLTYKLIANLDSQQINYWLILDNMAYINTLVDMAYHLILALLCLILYLNLIFFMYIIYLIFYPIRRKINKENRKYHDGEVNHPYRKKRILGACIGGIRSTITAVIAFSFLGSLIFIVTGGTNLPSRDNLKEEETIEFSNPNFNNIYDYYSYICEMGNTGIFGVLNGIRDTNQTPFYFYFADLVLQGKINDENLGIENERFYLRDELGEYVHFVNSTVALLLKYSEVEDLELILQQEDKEEMITILMQTMQSDGFVEEFGKLIDSFETKSFLNNICLSSLTSLINHIELVTPDNEAVIGIVHQLFKSEDAIKVSDLATGADIKNLFKGLISVVATLDLEADKGTVDNSEGEKQIISTKQTIAIAQKLLPTIQELSLFQERKDAGNKIIKGLYTYCSENLLSEEMSITVPQDINWIDEFNVLMRACDPLLTIGYEIYDDDSDVMISNLANIFEGEHAELMSAAFDTLSAELVQSNLLDVVFKSSYVGKIIDDMVVSITKDESASIPKDISYTGSDGECSVLLKSLKLFLKNGGGPVLLTMMEEKEDLNSEAILQMIDIFTCQIEDQETPMTILDVLLDSKLLYYMVSTYLSYSEFGAFKLYLPNEAIEIIIEGTGENKKEYKLIKHEEIKTITDLLSNCKDLIVGIMDNPESIDYAKLLTNTYIKDTVDTSLVLQGTLANIIIGMAADKAEIILPESYDQPEQWLSSSEKGEIQILLDAVFDMANGNEALVNDLMNGNIKASALLELDNSVLETLCSSKVLRYTICDKITTLGSNSFEIVVARSSIEKLSAKTTTEKTVNVISASELSEIFKDIKSIVTFDAQDQVKVNYNAIFENKAEISKNKTITATLIQMMLKYKESGFLVVPITYQVDFEKLKTEEVLLNNVWFGATSASEDDELYLMLAAIESLIDKDENGKIPEDFDLEGLQDSLIIKESGIDTLCTSAILNASISKQIVDIFSVPTDVYQNELIERQELDSFFESIFKLFGRSEILAKELDSDLFDIHFKSDAVQDVLASVIMRSTISEKMIQLDQIYIPQTQAQSVSYVNQVDGFIIDELELQNIFNALFAILNQDEIAVNSIDQQLNSLALELEDIDVLMRSEILKATISHSLVNNSQLIVPNSVAQSTEFLNGTQGHMLEEMELTAFIKSLFVLFETNTIEMSQIENLLQDFSLNETKVDQVLLSSILQATISNKFLSVESLVIPNNVENEIMSIKNELQTIIAKEELNAFLKAVLVTSNGSISGSNYDFSQLVLPTTIVDANTMTTSLILSATLTEKIMTVESSILVVDELLVPYVFQGTYSDHFYILQSELSNLLIALTVGMNISDPMNLSFEDVSIPTTERQKNALIGSTILRATISEKVLKQDRVVIEQSSDNIYTQYHYQYTSIGILSGQEILSIIRGIELLNPEQGNFDNLVLDVGDIIRMDNKEEVLEAISKSDIYRSIISQTLAEEISFAGRNTQAYQMFLTDQATAQIIVEGNPVIYHYSDALILGKYVINYPSEQVEVYTSFYLESSFAPIFGVEDILALQYTLQV